MMDVSSQTRIGGRLMVSSCIIILIVKNMAQTMHGRKTKSNLFGESEFRSSEAFYHSYSQ